MAIATIDEARERVKLGAALLDAVRGDDWRSMINLDTLSIKSVKSCILGQIYGDYFDGHRILSEAIDLTGITNWPARHGFAGVCECCSTVAMFDHTLDQAWREYLTQPA